MRGTGPRLHAKLERLRRLMEQGYDLAEVDSDHGVVEATFRRRGLVVKVTFAPHEAEAILLARLKRA